MKKRSLSFPLLFFSFLTLRPPPPSPPRTTVIFALIFSPVLFCDVVESIYRGFSCPRARPARPSVLFSSSAIRAQVRGPYRPRLPNCGKPPTRLRERRFDKDRTERTEENNWSAFVWIAGERTTLPKEFLLSRYLWPLLWSHGATDFRRLLSSYRATFILHVAA